MKYSNTDILFFKILIIYNLNLYNNIRNNIFKKEVLAVYVSGDRSPISLMRALVA